jgi:hypothetical protein
MQALPQSAESVVGRALFIAVRVLQTGIRAVRLPRCGKVSDFIDVILRRKRAFYQTKHYKRVSAPLLRCITRRASIARPDAANTEFSESRNGLAPNDSRENLQHAYA